MYVFKIFFENPNKFEINFKVSFNHFVAIKIAGCLKIICSSFINVTSASDSVELPWN